MVAAQKTVEQSAARRFGKGFLFSLRPAGNLLHQYHLMMKLAVLTLSALFGIVLAAPAKANGADPLIFWTFKDTTLHEWSLYCKSGQNVEEILGDIPGGPYICGFMSMTFYTFKDSAGHTQSVYCVLGEDVKKILGDQVAGPGPYICGEHPVKSM